MRLDLKSNLPLKMGTLSPAILHDIKALVTTLGRVVLPATQVTPNKTLSYFLQISAAMMIQRASSPPTSQSMTKYLGEGILQSFNIIFLRIYILELVLIYCNFEIEFGSFLNIKLLQ